MLHEFLTANRTELVERCQRKVTARLEMSDDPPAPGPGVPVFLQQLIETLEREQTSVHRDVAGAEAVPSPSVMGRAAALNGAQLLDLGYSVDQVVHEYGDLCQSVTELAIEQQKLIATDEFRTLNRCLDDAIAEAVAAFSCAGQVTIDREAQTLHTQLDEFADEHRRLVDIAIHAYSAIRTGNIGVTGATGALLMHTLRELRSLAERTLPEHSAPKATSHADS